MTKLELEMWVRDIVSRIEIGQPDEDHRVELKSQWKEAKEIVRQFAGHANVARGERILWIIGVDAKNRVVTGADQKELSTWLPQLQAEFNEATYPELVEHLNITIENKTVVALLFETDRYPYVIKNSGGRAELEIPWRDATRTKSATRSNLLRLLSPLQKLPSVEVISGQLRVSAVNGPRQKSKAPRLEWTVNLSLYVVPRTASRICIPDHRCKAWLEVLGCITRTGSEEIAVYAAEDEEAANSISIRNSYSEIFIDGPGTINIKAKVETEDNPIPVDSIAEIAITLSPIDTEQAIAIKTLFKKTGDSSRYRPWKLEETILTQQQYA